jgi:hypothetical protein
MVIFIFFVEKIIFTFKIVVPCVCAFMTVCLCDREREVSWRERELEGHFVFFLF